MSLFTDKFEPDTWQGAKAKAAGAASDVFQQLLGDGLSVQFAALAHTGATAGKDGGIDAWVDTSAFAGGQFSGFEFPLIVECKHHDTALPALATNIAQGWGTVKEKLTRQAQAGWPGLYQPWPQARSYLYCISACFPHQKARDDFQNEIRAFFAALPAGQRPPIAPAHSAGSNSRLGLV